MHDGGWSVVLELQERRVVARDGPLRHPLADLRAHAAKHAAAEQANGVNLVRALPIRNAAALGHVELVGGARPQHPVGVGPDVQRAQTAIFARVDHPPHGADRQREGASVTGEQLDTISFSGLHHAHCIFEGDGHRLFDHDVFPRVGGQDGVVSVETVRTGDPHRVDLSILTQRLRRRIRPRGGEAL